LFGILLIDLVGPIITSSILIPFEVLAVLVEAAVICILLVRNVAKALVSSFTVNLITGLLNLLYFFAFWIDISTYHRSITIFAAALLINILVEGFILKNLYRQKGLKNILCVSTIMNSASFTILIFFINLWLGV